MTQELDEGQLKALEKIEKLLKLSARNPNPEEAAAAAAKAQDLLIAYNLSSEMIGQGSSGDAKREKTQRLGGMYKYQRWLWYAIADLNFCLHFVVEKYTERNTRRRRWDGSTVTEKVPYYRHHHTVVGKRVNVAATFAMGQYIEGAIERLVKERFPLHTQRFKTEAVAFREGMAEEIYWRLRERREKLLEEERERRTRDAATYGVSTATALTLADLSEAERDANEDFLHGEGYSARKRAARAERAAAAKAAEDAYTQWAAENPEEARKEEAKARKEAEKHRNRSRGQGSRGGMSGEDKRRMLGTYWQGREAGRAISLDPQTSDHRSETKRLK